MFMSEHIIEFTIWLCIGLGADHLTGPFGLQPSKIDAGIYEGVGAGSIAFFPRLVCKVLNLLEVGGREINDSVVTSPIGCVEVDGRCADESSMALEVARSADGEHMARRKKNASNTVLY